jgi:hypothetical protein
MVGAEGTTFIALSGPVCCRRTDSAALTKSCHIVAGRLPPTTPAMGELSSLPTQTPTTRSEVDGVVETRRVHRREIDYLVAMQAIIFAMAAKASAQQQTQASQTFGAAA